MPGPPARVIFSVPHLFLDEARAVVAGSFDFDEDEPVEEPRLGSRGLPWQPMIVVGSVILLHMSIVILAIAQGAERQIVRWGGLLKGVTLDEPWRLLTSLFLHSDPRHVFWNGASMMVFAVPLLMDLGYARTGLIYFTAGIGGAIVALQFATPGTLIIGSSGAVAGLFGAWVVVTLRYARRATLTWRARIRTLGIALLVLPSLISPVTSTGQQISVSSHMGGLATGMLIGALISSSMMPRPTDSSG